jgi:hypothetical protein
MWHCLQRKGIAAGVELIACPARNCCPIMILKYKIITKSQIEIHPTEPLLIANYCRSLQRPATLEAIPMLAVALFVK